MLNKEICKQCMNEWFRQEGISATFVLNLIATWGDSEEGYWKEGYIRCSHSFYRNVVKGEIPERCRMALEQMMADQEC